MAATYIGSSISIFSSLYINIHRVSFQESIIESTPVNSEKLFLAEKDFFKIKWIEEGKEFEWNNKMYDVSKIVKTEKGFQIYCVNDNVEESFIAMFDQRKKGNAPTGMTKVIFQPQFCNQIIAVNEELIKPSRSYFFFVTCFYCPPISRAFSPPPEV